VKLVILLHFSEHEELATITESMKLTLNHTGSVCEKWH